MPSELAFDLVNKGELATVEKPTYVKGSKRAEASEQTQEYWVAPVQAAIRQAGAPTWVEIKLSRASGGGLVPFGIVSPAADLNTLLGSQGGSAAMLSSGDFWCNGQLRQRGYSKIDRGNVTPVTASDHRRVKPRACALTHRSHPPRASLLAGRSHRGEGQEEPLDQRSRGMEARGRLRRLALRRRRVRGAARLRDRGLRKRMTFSEHCRASVGSQRVRPARSSPASLQCQCAVATLAWPMPWPEGRPVRRQRAVCPCPVQPPAL